MRALLLLSVLLFFSRLEAQEIKSLTFTNSTASFEGEIVTVKGDDVMARSAKDGKVYTLKRQTLSAASQKDAATFERSRARTGSNLPPPWFEDHTWKAAERDLAVIDSKTLPLKKEEQNLREAVSAQRNAGKFNTKESARFTEVEKALSSLRQQRLPLVAKQKEIELRFKQKDVKSTIPR